jgi:hypothetical protein
VPYLITSSFARTHLALNSILVSAGGCQIPLFEQLARALMQMQPMQFTYEICVSEQSVWTELHVQTAQTGQSLWLARAGRGSAVVVGDIHLCTCWTAGQFDVCNDF